MGCAAGKSRQKSKTIVELKEEQKLQKAQNFIKSLERNQYNQQNMNCQNSEQTTKNFICQSPNYLISPKKSLKQSSVEFQKSNIDSIKKKMSLQEIQEEIKKDIKKVKLEIQKQLYEKERLRQQKNRKLSHMNFIAKSMIMLDYDHNDHDEEQIEQIKQELNFAKMNKSNQSEQNSHFQFAEDLINGKQVVSENSIKMEQQQNDEEKKEEIMEISNIQCVESPQIQQLDNSILVYQKNGDWSNQEKFQHQFQIQNNNRNQKSSNIHPQFYQPSIKAQHSQYFSQSVSNQYFQYSSQQYFKGDSTSTIDTFTNFNNKSKNKGIQNQQLLPNTINQIDTEIDIGIEEYQDNKSIIQDIPITERWIKQMPQYNKVSNI